MRRLRRLGQRAGRGCLALMLTGGWVVLAALPVGAAVLTWWDGLG